MYTIEDEAIADEAAIKPANSRTPSGLVAEQRANPLDQMNTIDAAEELVRKAERKKKAEAVLDRLVNDAQERQRMNTIIAQVNKNGYKAFNFDHSLRGGARAPRGAGKASA